MKNKYLIPTRAQMKSLYRVMVLISSIVIGLTGCSGKEKGAVSAVSSHLDGTVAIAFDFEERNTYSSNQFAIWIEDLEGNFIKTVYVTSFTANGGYKKREDAVPVWVEKSHIESASSKEIDAMSGATPKSGSLMYIWDLTDKQGQSVVPKEYKFYVEATVYKENRVIYSGTIDISGENMTVLADAAYTTELAKEEAIITNVRAIFLPLNV